MQKNYSRSSAGIFSVKIFSVFFVALFLSIAASECCANVSEQNVVILVNQDSPTSRYIAKMYRQYYPAISDDQVLNLTGLTDCSGPAATAADEIITRSQYNQLIAQPLRDYLLDANHPQRYANTRIIITTAGMPYRIEDTQYSSVIYPAGSSASEVTEQESSVDAASVESELTCLWYCEYGTAGGFQSRNRMVNPYQGYRTGIEQFEKAHPGTKSFSWTIGISQLVPLVESPWMEGILLPPMYPDYQMSYGTSNRIFHPGDIYLVCRLDGPKDEGKSAVFAVRKMLERAKLASSPVSGINPAQANAVLDDATDLSASKNFDYDRTFNLNYDVDFLEYDGSGLAPPDAPKCRVKEDFQSAYRQSTSSDPDLTLNYGTFATADYMAVALDRRASTRTTQTDIENAAAQDQSRDDIQTVAFLATFGINGDEGSSGSYLSTEGPDSGELFNYSNGAVFISFESFNAVTMFSDRQTPANQCKIIDFISAGGTAAIGHSFEPQPDATPDTEFLLYNLFADTDANGVADLTFAEAAFTSLPYLSWSEVVIGDPLMKIAYGPGTAQPWEALYCDVNLDNRVNYLDIWMVKSHYGGILNTTNPAQFEKYCDFCDVNNDGIINYADIWLTKANFGLTR